MNRMTVFILLALASAPALAHELARDGNVGALMHTYPDDAPPVAKPTAVFFELNQKGGRAILLSQCRCTLSVYSGSAVSGRAPLLRGVLKQGKGELLSSVTFPKVGAYTMILAGTPKTGASFPAFKLSWVVRADGAGMGGMSH
jgi:hypothetical protein